MQLTYTLASAALLSCAFAMPSYNGPDVNEIAYGNVAPSSTASLDTSTVLPASTSEVDEYQPTVTSTAEPVYDYPQVVSSTSSSVSSHPTVSHYGPKETVIKHGDLKLKLKVWVKDNEGNGGHMVDYADYHGKEQNHNGNTTDHGMYNTHNNTKINNSTLDNSTLYDNSTEYNPVKPTNSATESAISYSGSILLALLVSLLFQ